MLSKDVDVQQGGQGDGSNHSFVPVTAKHRSPEKESMGQSKSGKDNLAPPITGIACIPADLVASLGGLEGGDLPLAPRPDIQTTEGWVGLDHDLHGPNVERVVEVATIGRLGEKLDGQAIVGLGGGWAQALWKKLARNFAQPVEQRTLPAGHAKKPVGKRGKGLRDKSSGSSDDSKRIKLSVGLIPHGSSLQSTVEAAGQPHRSQ
ncbi:hypothetical protein TEA_007313 [Camellia sinensis var. sinensis]|uniref:Uncharacterized protein n=1 Tax=Camellia sinensis var. sinensis TaxID=542762 RepID=A0A4V6RYH3_CAMSN|nr:hypothetical protein TEA_007313 [Camellia sinensis var. sinensis]